METSDNAPTRGVIGCAIKVHRTLGPGLLESAHEARLCRELSHSDLRFTRQRRVPVIYKGEPIGCDLVIDMLVEQSLVVETKSVRRILPVHEAQLLIHLKVSGLTMGLLLNFNEATLKQGNRRRMV
jgi:GxxExxY protein